MSEDRTQAPSKRRRDEARARGVVARSPELTAAIGLLAAVAMLGAWGGSLASACVELVRTPFLMSTSPDGIEAVAILIRASAMRVFLPLAAIVLGVSLAMIAGHQAQVGGMWASNLIAPDLRRVWSPSGADWASRAGRGAWGIAKAALLVVVAAWAIRHDWPTLAAMHGQAASVLGSTAAASLRRVAFALGMAALVLGLVDYWFAHRRVEELLRTTLEENREDAKAIEGDPAVRARRLRLAKSWRADPREVLAGAVVVVTGPGGLAIVLGGEGPAGTVIVRASARGASGAMLRRSAERAGLSVVASPLLAMHFAGSSARTAALPESLRLALAEAWPRGS